MAISPDQIKAARDLLGWSQKALAKKARLTAETIRSIETGKSRSTDGTLRKALEAGGIEITPWSVKVRDKQKAAPWGRRFHR